MVKILRYVRNNGRIPFDEWLDSLRDKNVQSRVQFRLRQLTLGVWGDAVPVGRGVIELRIHEGAGYRVYCARHGDAIVILFCGGSKSTQQSDIARAQRFWAEWKRSQK